MRAYGSPQQPADIAAQPKENQQAAWLSSKSPVQSPRGSLKAYPLQRKNQSSGQTAQ